MLQPIINELNSMRIVLASSSPRRKELMENIVRIWKIVKKIYKTVISLFLIIRC